MAIDNTDQAVEATYSQLSRQGKTPAKNTVPFIRDVLRAKSRTVGGYTKGTYQHTEAELVGVSNQWELDGRFFQHVTLDDGQGKVEITVENYDPTMCLADDDCGEWYEVKLRWSGSPTMDNLQGIVLGKIE